jgi:hypothetical protein
MFRLEKHGYLKQRVAFVNKNLGNNDRVEAELAALAFVKSRTPINRHVASSYGRDDGTAARTASGAWPHRPLHSMAATMAVTARVR